MKMYDMGRPKHIGKWGIMREIYLRDYDQEVYAELVRRGKLQEHLRMTDFQARERMAVLMDQGMKCLGITEDLKKRDRMEWIRQTNNLYHSAEENVKQELIYC